MPTTTPTRPQSPVQALRTLLPTLLAATALVFALWDGGGATASSAARQSAILAALACAALLIVRSDTLRAALRENTLSLLALCAIVLWSLFTTLPVAGPLAHPLYAELEVGPGAISLAPFRTLEGLAAMLFPVAAFALGCLAVSRPEHKARVATQLLAFGALFALGALIDYALGFGPDRQRLDAGLASANAAAAALNLFALLAIAVLLRRGRNATSARDAVRRALGAPLALATAILCLSALLLTASRGGAGSLVAALLVLAVATARAGRSRKPGAGLAASLAIALALIGATALLGGQFIGERFQSVDWADARTVDSGRWLLYQAHWEAFLERPLFGHGLNTYHEINAWIATSENWGALSFAGATHNVVLQLLEEQGLIGLALFAALFAPPLLRCLAIVRKREPGASWAALALSAFTLLFLHGMVDFALNVPAIAGLFAFMLGAFSRRRFA